MADLISMLAAASGVGGEYEIERSLRFNSADSAYLSRTFSSPTSATIWTFSVWAKRGLLGSTRQLLGASTTTSFGFNSSDQLNVTLNGTSAATSTAVFRDPSAWYHIVYQQNGSAQTIYVNNASVATGTTAAAIFNTAIAHQIGAANTTNYYNGYMTEIHFIDGQALTPSSFGEVNEDTGVWSPIRYAGTYGTNGFHLDFSDNSNTTASTLGKDYSGNGNNWTPSGSPGFSVTAGAGNDSLVDSPTRYGTDTGAGGEVRGNYCTWNPLAQDADVTLSNGNLDFSCTLAGNGGAISTMAVSSGKWYWELTPTDGGNTSVAIGIAKLPLSAYDANQTGTYLYLSSGSKRLSPSTDSSYGASYTNNDVIGVALDMDAGTVVFYKNGASQGTAFSSLSGDFSAWVQDGSNVHTAAVTANFGQRPFAHTAPSGFKALCTTNLPDPTVVQGDDHFNTVLYTGTGSSQSITGVGFQPDFVWIKERSGAADHGLYDAVRGVQNQLESNTTTAETVESTGLTAFGSDGFTVGALAQLNTNTDTYVSWNWKANGAGVSNTAGTITSTVSVNTTAGISIVTFTDAGSACTVGHGLGVAPAMIIAKFRGTGGNWSIYHQSLGNTYRLRFTTEAQLGPSAGWWDNTSPTSTVFSLGTDLVSNTTQVAYCFAEVEGFSKFSSYTGNGSADGPFVYTGFRPAFILMKYSNTTSYWLIMDTVRNTYNVVNQGLRPNTSDADSTALFAIDILSNGFKPRDAGGLNGSGNTTIYAAFAENPVKFSLAR